MGKLQKLLIELRGDMSLREAAKLCGISHNYLRVLERGIDPRSGKPTQPSAETLKRLASAYNYPYQKLLKAAGYLSEDKPDPDRGTDPNEIREAIKDDPELLEFWKQVERRDELKIFCKQARRLPASDIKLVVDIMRRIEQEEEDE